MIRVLVLLLTLAVIGSAQFGSITLIPKTDDSATGQLQFREKFANGTNYVGFKASASLSANVIWELPATDGTNGQCLTTNGSKVLSFGACSVTEPIILSNSVGEKVRLFRAGVNLDYGIGVQASQYQFYVPYNTSYFSFGYGTSGSFTEQVRIGNGVVDIGAFFLQGGSSLVAVKSHLAPQADNTYDLGEQTGTVRWRDLRLSRNAYIAGNLQVDGTCTGCGGLPGVDTTAVVKGSVDATKLLRFEVDGFTTATTRVLTPQNASYTIAGIDIANTFTSDQTISGAKWIWNNVLGGKIQLYQSGAGADFGMGIQANQYQFYVPYNTNYFSFGYGTSGSFTEQVRLGNGVVDIGSLFLQGGSFLVVVKSHITAQADATYDLGDQTGTVRWRDLRLSRDAYIDGAVKIGGNTAISSARAGSLTGLALSGSVTFGANNTYDLGTSLSRAATIYTTNMNVSGTCTGCGDSLPVVDSTAIAKGSSDSSKLLRFEVDGFTSSTTRTLTPQDASYTIAGINISNTFTSDQIISGARLLWNNAVGEKIRLYSAGTNTDYGLGVQASQFQFYVPYNTSYFSFGYGTSSSFTEQVRLGNGVVDIGSLFLQGGSSLVVVKSHLSPQADNTYDLGEQTGTVRWRDLRLARNAYIDGNLTIAGTCTGCASLPGVDTTAILKNAVDNTKLLRFDLSGVSAGTTRILTPQNASYTIAGTNIANTFTSDQTLSGVKLLWNNALGGKIQLYQSGVGADYGIGIQASQFQFYVPYNTYYFSFGYGTSSSFTEQVRIGNGVVDIGAFFLQGGSSIVAVKSHLAPQADATYDLGEASGTVRWRDLRLSRDAYIARYVFGEGFYARPAGSSVDQIMVASASSGYIGTQSNHPTVIRTNNIDRVTVAANGDVTFANNVVISGTCTGCGAASVWTRNAGGYLYPTTTTDKLMIGGSGTPADMLEVVGGVRLSGHITYSSGSAYDIGTNVTRARTAYLTNLDVSGTCTGCGGGWTRNGGGYVYPTTTTDITVVGGNSAPSGTYKLEVQGGGINSGGSIVPGSNVSYALGSSTLLWNVAYISTLRVADRIIGHASNSSGTVLFAGSAGPATDNTYDLGEPTGTVQWRDLRLGGKIYVDGYSGLDSGTITCPGGEAIKSLSFHGGIVTGYVCGTP